MKGFVNIFEERSFTPHQPYLEYNNKYYSYKPRLNEKLCGIVWEIYQVENFDITKSVALPDICADIMVFYTDNNAYCYFMSGTLGIRSMREIDFMNEVHTIFGVKLCTGILGNLFGCGARDVGAGAIEGELAFLNGAYIIDKLKEAKEFSERWSLVEEYLITRLSFNYEVNYIAKYISKVVVDNHGNVSIKSLEKEIGYSGRYLRKIINDNLGVSIKQLCEVTQFQWIYHIYKQSGGKVKFSDLAIQGGYYDQSHMNSSCKKLTGCLPTKIMNLYSGENCF